MIVSVCMATYNGAKYLKEQVDSILCQEFTENPNVELELIVSDDGSTDDTIKILEGYGDARIKIYHHKEHKTHRYYNAAFACTSNFGYAISKAIGEYIFLSDQDDVWYPWKIDKSITTLKKYGGGVIGAAFDTADGNLNKMSTLIYKDQSFFKLRFSHSLYGFSCGFSRDELRYILPIPEIPQHDTFIMLTAKWRNRMHYIDEVCAIHRYTGSHNVSSIANNTPQWVRLWYRMKIWFIVIVRSIIKSF